MKFDFLVILFVFALMLSFNLKDCSAHEHSHGKSHSLMGHASKGASCPLDHQHSGKPCPHHLKHNNKGDCQIANDCGGSSTPKTLFRVVLQTSFDFEPFYHLRFRPSFKGFADFQRLYQSYKIDSLDRPPQQA